MKFKSYICPECGESEYHEKGKDKEGFTLYLCEKCFHEFTHDDVTRFYVYEY